MLDAARSGALEECSIRRLGGVLDPALWRSAKGSEAEVLDAARSGALEECLDPAPWGSA